MKLRVNGKELEFPDALRVSGLIEHLGLRSEQVAVELNRDIVRREQQAETELKEGDSVEVVTLVGGG